MSKPAKATKKKKRINVSEKLRAILQKEINSVCPFCPSEDVDHFEVHHIDEDASNTVVENLLMLCPTCHSKITKGDISKREVVEKKNNLKVAIKNKIELVNIGIDSKNCSWTPHEELDNCFFDQESPKSPFPILDFTFINHFNKTIVLKAIKVRVKHLYSGLSGFPVPSEVLPLGKYPIPLAKEVNLYRLPNPIQIPTQQAFRFQVELFEKLPNDENPYPVDGKNVLYFTFEFSDGITLTAPNIYLNCKDENEKMKILLLT